MADTGFDRDLFVDQPRTAGAERNRRYRSKLRGRESIPPPSQKRCCSCKLTKDANQFHKNRSEPDGLATRCKLCKAGEHRASFEAKAADYRPADRKTCFGCNLSKPASEFHRQTASSTGLSSYCGSCQPAISAAFYQQNRAAIKRATWVWKKENPDRARAQSISLRCNRRAKVAGVEGTFTPQEWIDLLQASNHQCRYCSRDETCDRRLTADHKLSLYRGGTGCITNIAPACLRCNTTKGDKTPEEYAAWRKANVDVLAI